MMWTGRSGMSAPTAKLAWEIPLRLARSRAYRERVSWGAMWVSSPGCSFRAVFAERRTQDGR
jgi:hypothetical protein